MTTISKRQFHFLTGLLLSLPTAYFIFISILKYELGYSYLFDRIQPALEELGIKESFGLNINLLILFGPVLALLLNLLSILQIRVYISTEKVDCQVAIKKSWWNLSVVLLSSGILLVLGSYLFLENCHC